MLSQQQHSNLLLIMFSNHSQVLNLPNPSNLRNHQSFQSPKSLGSTLWRLHVHSFLQIRGMFRTNTSAFSKAFSCCIIHSIQQIFVPTFSVQSFGLVAKLFSPILSNFKCQNSLKFNIFKAVCCIHGKLSTSSWPRQGIVIKQSSNNKSE